MSIIARSLLDCRYALYREVNLSNPLRARLGSPLIAATDVVLGTIATPLAAIENIARAAFSVLATLFGDGTVKETLQCAEIALSCTVKTPVKVIMAPLKFVYQMVILLKDPKRATCF